ncbi:MAG TPA: AAA family ATPase [Spirochaetota bacterium]|nr:AAA family ATPase [Spirochaetota bacterium]HOM38385.1 AAA family ATPase [Spirochaetota bacterium]HPQ48397.1 AAA family ATPase [Spirochaetota bacterium]
MKLSDIRTYLASVNIQLPYEFQLYILRDIVELLGYSNDKIKYSLINVVSSLFIEIENGSTCYEIEMGSEFIDYYYQGYFTKIITEDERNKNFFVLKRFEKDGKFFISTYRHFVDEMIVGGYISERIKKNINSLNFLEINNESTIDMILSNNISVITGPPGSGKTTLATRIYRRLKEIFKDKKIPNIKICAPTGKAANVLTSKVGGEIESYTIHRLLSYNPSYNSFRFNRENRLECDLLIVDEASMIDLTLFRALLEGLDDDSKIIIIGDKNQLPPVGEGAVFSELVNLLKEYVIELKKVYRTENRRIIDIADRVKEGDGRIKESIEYIDLNRLVNSDIKYFDNGVYFVDLDNRKIKIAIDFYLKILAEEKSSIILTFTNRGLRGSDTINNIVLNSYVKNYYIKDVPIIITRNDYENNLFNGDILYLDRKKGIAYLDEIGYNINLIKDYKYAFAVTVHKSQGSEYNNVFIFLPDNSDSPMLSREILYTAITRAKERVFIFGKEETLKKCFEIKLRRSSMLKYFIN